MLSILSRHNKQFCKILYPSTYRAFSQAKMFDKVLIANRAEIAIRIMQTCKKLNIKTVAVYSDSDASAYHTRFADEAVNIGPSPSSQSYLNYSKILAACKSVGANAVHPGYGFLSEKASFAEYLESNNVVFIGPKANEMKQMGDKITSKQIAKAAGVNTIPGYNGQVKSPEHAVKLANEIGYPVMIKASSGGGGKGMRICYTDKDVEEGFRLSSSEALSSFNDDRLLIEKYIENPRHIEIQIMADAFGNVVYLNERECSIQRRNQKVIEESPSIFVDQKIREQMGKQAVSLAKHCKYQSAGTVEFLVDKNKNFYFLEMNTRLQVEHPVTEFCTGFDLVELMLKVACGQQLPIKQSDVKLNGSSIEARVYAEDPLNNFLPSIGTFNKYIEPKQSGNVTVRVDSGVCDGDNVSIYYDPIISKVITHGKNREEARKALIKALDSYVIQGPTVNVPFLSSILRHPDFIKGDFSTAFIKQHYPKGFKGHILSSNEKKILISSIASVFLKKLLHQRSINLSPSINASDLPDKLCVSLSTADSKNPDDKHVIIIDDFDKTKNLLSATIDGESIVISTDWQPGQTLFSAQIEGEKHCLQVLPLSQNLYQMQFNGSKFHVSVLNELQSKLLEIVPKTSLDNCQSKISCSPMPGAVLSVKVKKGDTVVKGQELCVIEAMKMQNIICTEVDGKIKKVNIKEGDTVAANQAMVELE